MEDAPFQRSMNEMGCQLGKVIISKMPSLNQIFNRFRNRASKKFRRHSLPKLNMIVRNTDSNHSLQDPCPSTSPALPDSLMLQCLDAISNPFELYRLRALSKSVKSYVEKRLAKVTEMDVKRVDFDGISAESVSSTSEVGQMFIYGSKFWHVHPAGYKVLMRLSQDETKVEILVDNHWTSKDVITLCGAMNIFRKSLKKITLDAPIVELIIASLSMIDLDRWYAFQCFMKAVNDHQMQLAILNIPLPDPNNPPELYWPYAEELVIRTTEKESSHLARILDYGVRSHFVMDRRRLDALKVIIMDVQEMNRNFIRNLYHFRCWAGSAGFDDRFSQQYCVNVV